MQNPPKRVKLTNRSFKNNEMNASAAGSFSENLNSIPQSFADCVQWALLNFKENFTKQENFAPDKDPREFDSNDSSHLDFVVIEAVSRAKICGLPQLDRNQIVELILQAEKKCSAESTLPDEIWNLVFNYFRVKDLKNVSLVCKRFHEVIADSMELMKCFKVKLTGEIDLESFRFSQIMTNSIRKYRNVKIANLKWNSCDWILDFIRKHPIVEMRLEHVVLREDTLVQICEAVQNTLVNFEIDKTTVSESSADNKDFKTLAKSVEWKKLKTFHVDAGYLNFNCLFKYLPKNIENFELGFFKQTPSPINYMNQQTNLKNVYFINSIGFPNDLKEVLLQIPRDHLKELTFAASVLIDEEFATAINEMKNLEKLTLLRQNYSKIKNVIKMFCPTLKSFEFSTAICEFSNDMMDKLLSGFPSLEEFDIRGCVGDKIIEKISKYNTKLKILKCNTFGRRFIFGGVSMPNLMEFEINCYRNWNILEDFNFFESCPNVKKITIKGKIKQNDFETILRNATNLKFLEICDGSYLPGNVLELNEQLLMNLQILKIYNFGQQTEASKALLAKHPTLRSYIKSSKF